MNGIEIVGFIFLLVAIAAGVTAALCLTVGKRILRQDKFAAMAVCGLGLPISIIVVGAIVMIVVGERGGQAVVMLAGMFCFWAIPVSLLTSYAMIETIAQRGGEDDFR